MRCRRVARVGARPRRSVRRPEHAGSRVRFDGQYGAEGHRRQYYKCVPANGDRPHRFTEVLPREESWKDACELCERDVEFHEGPHAARKYQFVARGIAEALVAVGAGSTYREAAWCRARAGTAAAGRRGERGAAVLAARVAGDGLGRGVRAGRVRARTARARGRRAGRCCSTTCRSACATQRRAFPDRVPGVRRDGV